MELVPVLRITISRLFQNGSGSEQGCPSSYYVTPVNEKKTRKIQKSIIVWIRQKFQERQWKSN
jgi:hypothetical protein